MDTNLEIKNEEISDKEIKIEKEMISITRPETVEKIPVSEINEIILEDIKAIEEYERNIAVREARIEQYQNLLDNHLLDNQK